jgi:predicted Zn-dependent peptidase
MKEFMYELNRLRDEPVPAEELDNAKRAIIGSFALSLEQPGTLLQNIITQKLYNLPADYWDTYPQKVSAITAADVQKAAQKYLDMSHLQVVAVGDASKAREVLTKYGKVEVYDADGKPVAPGSDNSNKK